MRGILLFLGLAALGQAAAATITASEDSTLQEITIDISSEHKAVISALLDAVEAETPITGIAAFDALSSTYGLIGIYRSRISPFYYGNRFRLTFPSAADVAAIAGAYGNLSYITLVEPDPPLFTAPLGALPQRTDDWDGRRIARKLGSGVLGGSVSGPMLGLILANIAGGEGDTDGIGAYGAFILGGFVGYPVGVGLGVSAWDRHDYFRSLVFSLGGSFLGAGIGFVLSDTSESFYDLSDIFKSMYPFIIVSPITATLVSELSRGYDLSPFDILMSREARRFSGGLVPDPKGLLSAVATLRF